MIRKKQTITEEFDQFSGTPLRTTRKTDKVCEQDQEGNKLSGKRT
jgi:hypothetical protein